MCRLWVSDSVWISDTPTPTHACIVHALAYPRTWTVLKSDHAFIAAIPEKFVFSTPWGQKLTWFSLVKVPSPGARSLIVLQLYRGASRYDDIAETLSLIGFKIHAYNMLLIHPIYYSAILRLKMILLWVSNLFHRSFQFWKKNLRLAAVHTELVVHISVERKASAYSQ